MNCYIQTDSESMCLNCWNLIDSEVKQFRWKKCALQKLTQKLGHLYGNVAYKNSNIDQLYTINQSVHCS